MDAALLVERRYRFGSGSLASAGMNQPDWHVGVDGAKRVADHVTTLIGFSYQEVGLVPVVRRDCCSSPVVRCSSQRDVIDDVAVAILTETNHNDACLRAVCFAAGGRVDGDNNSGEGRCLCHSVFFEYVAAPECTEDVVEYFCMEFLTSESGSFVAADDFFDEAWGQIGGVVIR